ncbi:MAG: divergent polysaccharide deacetylase family protein [Candidatus Eisenbacteria bacterium]|nr:divergent polysaccharide deacetylase family protein [Candidatus Eisenbacteria bacterium]
MSKRKSRGPLVTPKALGVIAAIALALFVIGEGVRFVRSDGGRLLIARATGLGARADLIRLVAKPIRLGLASVAVPRDSVSETPVEGGAAPMRWRVGLAPNASLLQANYAITRSLENAGAVVMSATERWTDPGAESVHMLVGLPHRPTHEVILVRAPGGARAAAAATARLALVLYGFGDDAAAADSFFTLPQPFAVAVVAGGPASERVMAHARDRSRELVLHLPLEPLNYPRINPGPGALLVSMKSGEITRLTRRYLDQAGAVAAVANHMGSLATQDMTVMRAVYKELKRRHVPFLHVAPAAGAVCRSLASDMGVVYAESDEVLDGETRGDNARALEKRWTAVLAAARKRGHVVALVRATPLTRRWLAHALEPKRLGGVSIVPLASLVDRPAAF